MLRVGITGGYASGKTLVASQFAALGCHVVYADELGHAVLEAGGEAYAPVVQTFGPEILRPDGSIDRAKLGRVVFPVPEKLTALTAIVHPAVFRLEEQRFQSALEQDPDGIFMVEAAILVETGRYRVFDRLILTTCEPETQIARAIARDGGSREQALARIARQWSFERKRAFASYVIDTSGPKEVALAQVRDIYRELRTVQSC